MSRAVLFLEDDEILDTSRINPAIVSGRSEALPGGRLEDTLAAVERRAIGEALEAANGDVEAAAEKLGLSRATLYRRMKALDIAIRENGA